jgi:hypothetical protein
MRLHIAFLFTLCLHGQTQPQPNPTPPRLTVEDFKKRIAAYPPDEQVYELWRFWLVDQPPGVQKLFDRDETKPKGLELYRKQLQAEGDPTAEVERKLRIIDKDGERWEIERWNRVLTSNSPRINWRPNGSLVEMVKGRKLGRALDVGMGQGRNALWLSQQGWETTGYDPAEKAVALAERQLILLSYVEIRDNAEKVIRALAPGGIVVTEYFHQDSGNAPGGFGEKRP